MGFLGPFVTKTMFVDVLNFAGYFNYIQILVNQLFHDLSVARADLDIKIDIWREF